MSERCPACGKYINGDRNMMLHKARCSKYQNQREKERMNKVFCANSLDEAMKLLGGK